MPILYAIEAGQIENLKILLNDPRFDVDVDHIYAAANDGSVEMVTLLLGDKRIHPQSDDNKVIKDAISNGNEEIVHMLLSDKRVSDLVGRDDTDVLRMSVRSGKLGILKEVVSKLKLHVHDIVSLLLDTCRVGNYEMVEFCLDKLEPSEISKRALVIARNKKRADIEELLLSRMEP
ncbi:Hypothetical protein POVR2_LOCUS308 [uncultured virus]|nr:Hypothetical protein POVR2_LOCUS308 [uncultured virus]